MKQTLSLIFCICLCIALAGSAYAQQQNKPCPCNVKSKSKPMVEYLNPKGGSNHPFSEAVRIGDLLILSGKIGTDSSGKLVTGGIKAETKQTMDNIRSALEAYGSSLDQVVKCTVMMADMKEWGEMNEIYKTYFKKDRMPARSALGANGLALGALVEIECWATVTPKPSK